MASNNKHINKLEEEISKKQEYIEGHIVRLINRTQKIINKLEQDKAKEEKEIADLRQQQEALKNHKPGHLANVSMYEFINDWVRPEIAWHIFSYLAEDPHKKGIKKARTQKRKWFRKCYGNTRGYWADMYYDPTIYHSPQSRDTPYCKLRLYKEISLPYYRDEYPGNHFRTHHNTFDSWVRGYEYSNTAGLSKTRLTNTNPILYELWKFHKANYVGIQGNKRFEISKKDIVKYLKERKVPRRTDLTYGVKCSESNGTEFIYDDPHRLERPPFARRELCGALMKYD